MYAIFVHGSHQYRVSVGDIVTIDKRPEEPGTEITLDHILLIVPDSGPPLIGTPKLEGRAVRAKILQTYRGKKIIIRKFRRRKGYRRKKGHRQTFSTIQILAID
jgi:large subunit ribosomal protein L21